MATTPPKNDSFFDKADILNMSTNQRFMDDNKGFVIYQNASLWKIFKTILAGSKILEHSVRHEIDILKITCFEKNQFFILHQTSARALSAMTQEV